MSGLTASGWDWTTQVMAVLKQPFTSLDPTSVGQRSLKEVIVQGRAFLILHTGVQGTRPDANEDAAASVDWPALKPRLSPIPGCFIVETVVPAPSWGGPLILSISCNLA